VLSTAKVSTAKTNDLKPLLGEALAGALAQFDWWGHLQEDLVLGNLGGRFASPGALAAADVLSPFGAPHNASGVLMLYRNEHRLTTLWRQSAAARRVLESPSYLVFDESGWGALAHGDNLGAVLGREAVAGRLRFMRGGVPFGVTHTGREVSRLAAAGRWMASDRRHARGVAPRPNDALVACWSEGALYVSAGAEGDPCSGYTRRGAGRQVALLHLSSLKRQPAFSQLRIEGEAAASLAAARQITLTEHGLWWPLPSPNASSASEAAQHHQHAWLSGLASPDAAWFRLSSKGVRAYLLGLSARDAARRRRDAAGCARATSRHASLGSPACDEAVPPQPPLPCVVECAPLDVRWGPPSLTSSGCTRRLLTRLGVALCAASL